MNEVKMGKNSYQYDENSSFILADWLATYPSSIDFLLTDEQKMLRIPKMIIILANIIFDFQNHQEGTSSSSSVITEYTNMQRSMFQKLQERFHRTREEREQSSKNGKQEVKSTFYQLSPRIIEIKNQKQKEILRSICRDYLRRYSDFQDAEDSLEQILVDEEKKEQKKKKSKRKKQKQKKKVQENEKSIREINMEKVPAIPEVNDIDGVEMIERETQIINNDKIMNKNINNNTNDKNEKNPSPQSDIIEVEELKKELRKQKRFHLEQIQQVQLKAFIADSKATACSERLDILKETLHETKSLLSYILTHNCDTLKMYDEVTNLSENEKNYIANADIKLRERIRKHIENIEVSLSQES